MDMKKLSKPRMEDYERRKRREREKIERQQGGVQSVDRETSLFPEPRRVNPSEGDDEITATLGNYLEARDYINQYTVGISNSAHRQVPPSSGGVNVGNNSASAPGSGGSTSVSASQQRLQPPIQTQQQQQQQKPSAHHYQQQPQQNRPGSSYIKQADNKPPYNGRGGYPGQPMKNDIRSSSGMAPPRGPPNSSTQSSNTSSLSLPPPATTQMPNGRSSITPAAAAIPSEKPFLVPPSHNGGGGRFLQPPMMTKRQNPPEKDVTKIISEITNNFSVTTPLTEIAATPHTTIRENYNLNGPNKHIYAFDTTPITPIGPLGSPPQRTQPIIAPPALVTPLAPRAPLSSPIAPSTTPLLAPVSSAAITAIRNEKSPLKPLKTEKCDRVSLEKQDSCLENDLELSESDDDHKKDSRSGANSSESSPSDSSDSGSDEESTKDDQQLQQLQQLQQQQQQQQQQQHQQMLQRQLSNASSNGSSGGNSSKKISQTIIATGGNSISSIFVSSGLSSVGSTSSGIGTHSSSSSNKTPSPTDSKKWDLSRFFSKPTSQQTQESGVSPGSVGSVSCGNVSMKVPGILPGGAQIIPEAMDVTTAIVKNENDDDNDDDEDDDDDNNVGDGMTKARVADLQAAGAIRYGAGLSVTPMSTVAIKKEAADVITSAGVQKVPMLNASDCVAIPKGQIKRESSLMEEQRRQEGLARLSESNSDSDSPNDAVTVPMPGPGGTLQIPRVPATITALPRHPLGAPTKLPPPPTLHNSVTMTPIAPLPTSPKPTRQKKVRKKKQPPATAPSVDSSDEEGISSSKKVPDFHSIQMNAMNMANVGNMANISSLNVIAAASAALTNASVAPVAQKKGRGRPRKQHQQPHTPQSQSGNLSSASSNAKGPTLTANKVVPKKPKAVNSRRRDNSSNSSTSTTPTKAATKIVAAAVPVPLLHAHNNNNVTKNNMHSQAHVGQPPASAVNSSSEDSSSSSSESFSHSKTSSSSSTDSDSDRSTQSKLRLRVVKLNKAGTAPAAPIVSSPSTTSTSDDDDDVPPHIAATGASTTENAAPVGRGSQHQQQSPFKVGERSARSQVSTSSSSSSSSSSSDDDEHTDSDEGASHKKKLRREKPKINRNKINTLTRIFNPKEGGAKKQGQVVIIDQSEEMLANKQQQQAAAAAAATAVANSVALTSQLQQSTLKHSLPNNLYQKSDQPPSAVAAQSPRLTPGSMRSPRNTALHSNLQQQQRIKTPTRTPPTTRTPTPTHQMLQQHTAAAVAAASPARTTTPILTSLICKIDITRLLRISPEWQNNNYRLYGVRNTIVVGGHTPNATSGRTPIYDHESILNADLQASTAQMRLKVAGNSSTRSGSRTPTAAAGILSNSSGANHTNLPNVDRELSRSRESLHEMASNGNKQRLDTCDVVYAQNGHLSSRSTDGATTPKQSPYYPASLTPNGYTSATSHSPSSAKLAHGAVKHEHIKYEPDVDAAYDSKAVFKASGVKQEHHLLHLKQDLKPQPGELHGKLSPPEDGNGDTKPRRKRSTSSSSSPYKEKKRKKEKQDRDNGINTKEKEIDNNVIVTPHEKELLMLEQQMPHTNHDRLLLDKQQLLQEAHATNNNNSNNNNNNNVNIIATSPTTQHILKGATVAVTKASCIVMPPPPVASSVDQQQHGVMPPSTAVPIAGAPQVIYRSYFERDEEQLSDDFRKNNQFLQEAITRKHAADDEKDSFNQVTLYLEAVVYFLLTGAAMERHNDNAAWTMYKDTLTLIKFISTKFRSYQVSSTNGQHETHNKVAILSLRCQSLISLKLYKLRRAYCRTIINVCSDFFKNGKGDIVNGNTPSSTSPSNSVCSQGSGSNTPPGKIVPQDIHNQLLKQNEFFTYLTSSHELWDQADRLVRQGNHTLFFIALDHENGPLTLHSTMYEVFRYVQAGLKRLRDAMSSGTGTNATATAVGGINAHHMMQ